MQFSVDAVNMQWKGEKRCPLSNTVLLSECPMLFWHFNMTELKSKQVKRNLSVPYICKDLTLHCSSSYPHEIDSFLASTCRGNLYNFQHQQANQKYRIFCFVQFINFSSLTHFRSKLQRAKEGMMMLPLHYFYDQALVCCKVYCWIYFVVKACIS